MSGKRDSALANRKRKHNWNAHTRQKSVEPGLTGLFFTCDGHEKQALNEAYNLLDELLEEKGNHATSAPSGSNPSDDEDIADSLTKACNREGDQIAHKKRRFHQRPTGVKNCLFVTVKDAEVVPLCEKLVETAQVNTRCRFLQRALPVEDTANVSLENVNNIITALVQRHLVSSSSGTLPTYALEFKARNNDQIKKQNVLEMLNDAIAMIAPAAKVDLSNPEITFFIQVVRKSIMAGVAPKYNGRRKYSMRVSEADSTKASTHSTCSP